MYSTAYANTETKQSLWTDIIRCNFTGNIHYNSHEILKSMNVCICVQLYTACETEFAERALSLERVLFPFCYWVKLCIIQVFGNITWYHLSIMPRLKVHSEKWFRNGKGFNLTAIHWLSKSNPWNCIHFREHRSPKKVKNFWLLGNMLCCGTTRLFYLHCLNKTVKLRWAYLNLQVSLDH